MSTRDEKEAREKAEQEAAAARAQAAREAADKRAAEAKAKAARLERQQRAVESAARRRERREEVEREAKERAAAQARVYVVKSGDSLSKTAKEILGDVNRWPEIFEANKDKIKDPNLIHPGQELRIPS
jgi:nucleoid-associated protein YgaU